jgi:hypothetical protein
VSVETFSAALHDLQRLMDKYPRSTALKMAAEQLAYLIDIESGKSMDRSKLGNINVGLIGLREVEDMDPELATRLYHIQAIAKKMAVK